MANDSVQIRFGAETDDLNAGIRLAQARVRQFQQDVQNLAKQIAQESSNGIVSEAQFNSLRQAEERLRGTQAELKNLQASAAGVGRMSADIKKFSDSIANAAFEYGPWTGAHVQLAQAVGEGLAGAFGAAGTATKVFGAALGGVAVAAGASLAIIAAQTESLRSLDDAARAAKVSMSALRDLNTAGAAVGIEAGQMNQEIAAFAQKMREAQIAGGDLADFLKENNVQIKDAQGNLLPVQQIFGKIVDLILSSNNEMDRLATLSKLGFSSDILRLFERQTDAVKTFANSAISAQDIVLKQGLSDGEALSAAWHGVWETIKNTALSASVSVLGAIGEIEHQGAAKFVELSNEARAAFNRITGDAEGAANAAKRAFEAQRAEVMRQEDLAVRDGRSPFGTLDLNAFGPRKQPAPPSDAPTIKGLYDKDDSKSSSNSDADRAARERLAARQREIDGQIQAARAGLQQQLAIYDAEVQLKQIGEDRKFALVQQATQREYETELALLQKELALEGLKPAQVQAINNRIQQLQIEHNTKMLQLDVQSIQATQKEWQDNAQKVVGVFDTQIKGLITGSMRFRDVFRNILTELLNGFIQMCEKMLVEHFAMEMAKTTATTSGASTRLAAEQSADSASMASNFATIIKAITASATQTFAGIFGFLSPIMGPAAVGPAAAGEATVMGAAAALPSFDVGAWSLPSDMVAQVHQGEMIVPAGPAAAFRSMMSAGNAPSSGVTVNHTTNFNVSAVDGQGMADFYRRSGKELMKVINENVRSGVHLGMSKIGNM